MRVSSAQLFQQGITAILNQQSQVNHTQQQLATGQRVLTPSDDPVAAVQIMDINEDLKQLDQYQRNSDLAEGQLALEEDTLAQAGTVLQRVRDLVLQANNATQTPETRQGIAVEIKALSDQFLALANTRDANGEYLFGGFQSDTAPFVRQGAGVVYNGDNGQRFIELGSGSQVAVRDPGSEVFQGITTGNGVFTVSADTANSGTAVAGIASESGSFVPDTYTITFSQATPSDPVTYQVTDSSAAVVASGNYVSGDAIAFAGASIQFDGAPTDGDSFQVATAADQDIFTTLQNIVNTLENAGAAPDQVAQINNALGGALQNIDQALGHLVDKRADVGVRLGQVESQRVLNETFDVQLQETLSNLQDLDYAEAISRLNLQLTALEAAQQAYVRVQGLSLFNYL